MTVTTPYFQPSANMPPASKVFDPSWADKLYRGLSRNLTVPFRLVVVTDEPRRSFSEPVETLKFLHFRSDFWAVMECLRVSGDPVLCMGLDTMITGNIDHMAEFRPRLALLRDPYHTNRMCNGVMMWMNVIDLYRDFADDKDRGSREYRLGGRPSEMLWLNGRQDADLNDVFPGQIRSWKAHVEGKETLGDARIVYFHGRRKPHEVDHPFIREHWR